MTSENYIEKLSLERALFFAQLIDANRDWIVQFCSRKSSSLEEATDLQLYIEESVLHNTSLQTDGYSEEQHLHWLQKAAQHAATDFFRHRTRKALLIEELCKQSDDDHAEQREQLDEMIAYLPANERLLINEILEGYTYQEIAERQQISHEAFRKRMQRIIIKLKTIRKKLYG